MENSDKEKIEEVETKKPRYTSSFAARAEAEKPPIAGSRTPKQITMAGSGLSSSSTLISKIRKAASPPAALNRLSIKRASFELPPLLRQFPGRDEDEEDITPAATAGGVVNMNQSFFGLLAATGSGDGDSNRRMAKSVMLPGNKGRRRVSPGVLKGPFSRLRRGSLGNKEGSDAVKDVTEEVVEEEEENEDEEDEHREAQDHESEYDSESEDDDHVHHSFDASAAPVMSLILDGQAEMASRKSFDLEGFQNLTIQEEEEDEGSSSLQRKLKEIFGFKEAERVIGEFPCALLKSVLLQGFMYVTEGHICFYAYLPQKTQQIVKSGYLGKSGRRNPKYRRHHFRLKGHQLTYHETAADLYFQTGLIDLSYASSVMVSPKPKDQTHFTLTLPSRTYHFKADSEASAKDWVRCLQKVIFRSHNDGDSVKICVPVSNVVDLEGTKMLDFAETVRVRVVDEEGDFAVDEYLFSFFRGGSEAVSCLEEVVGADRGRETERARERIRDTMSPVSPKSPRSQRVSVDEGRSLILRDTDFAGRRNVSGATASTSATVDLGASTDSYGVCGQEMMSSMDEVSVGTEGGTQASRILNGSEVFRRPVTDESRPQSAGSHIPEDTTGQGQGRPTSAKGRSEAVLSRIGNFPLQRAGYIAGYLGRTSRKMSSILATESLQYVERVSGMLKGGRKHYPIDSNAPGHPPANAPVEEDDERVEQSNERFRTHFGLPKDEKLRATYFCYIMRVVPIYGKIYVGERWFCFRSLLPGTRTKLILPVVDIETVDREKGFRFGYSGLVVVIRGHEELFFEFSRADERDDLGEFLRSIIEASKAAKDDLGSGSTSEDSEAKIAKAERDALAEERRGKKAWGRTSQVLMMDDDEEIGTGLAAVKSVSSLAPTKPLKIVCLSIGSRGDVQPYIALCKGLLAAGHHPKIVTHAEFGPWVQKHGIEFAPVGGDPAELMRLCIDNGMFTLTFLREATSMFRGWLDDLLVSAWEGCKDADVLIESPSAMAGIHISEALGIPYFRAFTMPWTRTRAYPHAFAVPEHKMGGAYNYMTYVMFDNLFWKGIASQVNRWRASHLSLPPTNLDKMQATKVPFLYNFSPSVVAPPLDFSDWIGVTGYWFLDEGSAGWEPPADLVAFIKKARSDGKRIVYVGFGSILVSDPGKMTQDVIDAVVRSDVRCILSKGWSERTTDSQQGKSTLKTPEPEIPDCIHVIKSAPHDWLFAQIDAAAHHGGSGTTGASLRAGIPTIIRPFFGDQFFFGSRVEDIGVGVCLKKWGATSFGIALYTATNDRGMIERAKRLGERIRAEDGVGTAIRAIWRDLAYARGLVNERRGLSGQGDGTAEGEEWMVLGETEGSEI